jgi:hypothetical protein
VKGVSVGMVGMKMSENGKRYAFIVSVKFVDKFATLSDRDKLSNDIVSINLQFHFISF